MKKRKGLAAMSPARRKAIAAKGGRARAAKLASFLLAVQRQQGSASAIPKESDGKVD